jgi:hypothetical protein
VQDTLIPESGHFSNLEDEFFNDGFNFGSYHEIKDRVEYFLSTRTQGNFTNIPFHKNFPDSSPNFLPFKNDFSEVKQKKTISF